MDGQIITEYGLKRAAFIGLFSTLAGIAFVAAFTGMLLSGQVNWLPVAIGAALALVACLAGLKGSRPEAWRDVRWEITPLARR
jgi:hypothetical protein